MELKYFNVRIFLMIISLIIFLTTMKKKSDISKVLYNMSDISIFSLVTASFMLNCNLSNWIIFSYWGLMLLVTIITTAVLKKEIDIIRSINIIIMFIFIFKYWF